MRLLILLLAAGAVGHAQVALVHAARQISLPSQIVDGNNPAIWHNGRLQVYTSTGKPILMSGEDLFSLAGDTPPAVNPPDHYPLWIEAVWVDDDGTVYGWYHHEPGDVCPGSNLTAPQIGALVSTDGGRTFEDLGIVLSSGDAPNCNAQNGFFASGHGDFSVILDQERRYFYFLFTNYGGAPHTQGIAIARMAFADRANPAGTVSKYSGGEWNQPGIGGALTAIFPAVVPWERSNTDSYWGPAIHWNTHLQRYAVVLSRACCETNWPQEGIYITFSSDLSDPSTWTPPSKILDARFIGFAPGYYPQVFGTAPGETDSIAGEVARLFVKGISKWEITFTMEQVWDPEPGPPQDYNLAPGARP